MGNIYFLFAGCTSIHSSVALILHSPALVHSLRAPLCVWGRVAAAEHLHLCESHFCCLSLHYEVQESKNLDYMARQELLT